MAKILQRAVRIDTRAFIQECAFIRKLRQKRLQALESTPMCCNSRCASVRGSTVHVYILQETKELAFGSNTLKEEFRALCQAIATITQNVTHEVIDELFKEILSRVINSMMNSLINNGAMMDRIIRC